MYNKHMNVSMFKTAVTFEALSTGAEFMPLMCYHFQYVLSWVHAANVLSFSMCTKPVYLKNICNISDGQYSLLYMCRY